MPPEIITVTELNRLARNALEREFSTRWVTGEISNLTLATSGHLYLTLKDENAQVRCAMFRHRAQGLPFRPENGQQVEAFAKVSLYEPRGDYQLNIESLRRAGLGRLYEAFVQLREKLARAGLFNEQNKRNLPRFPHTIGIITSPQAAAFQDVLAAFKRRAPHVRLILYPTRVQGQEAAAQIVEALTLAASHACCDLLLLVRGGGSLEDLWPFNEESVAQALSTCPIPVISGVGHETDLTIADLTADYRAATPTAAAEIASAGWVQATQEIEQLAQALRSTLRATLEKHMQRLDLLSRRLVHPAQRLARTRTDLLLLRQRLILSGQRHLQRQTARLERLSTGLSALNPTAVLSRGYAIALNAESQAIRDSRQITPNETLTLRFAKGSSKVVAIQIFPD
ncbi:MAG: exodeoxyribonuclease VII large subunit [Rhodocyclaceae bacterium]|nr:exodeoxyribonuclease VII large subunit [Rhodocyclaceae bacterium]